MAFVQWIGSNLTGLGALIGTVLGAVSMLLHLLKKDTAAAEVDSAKAVLDKLDGQAK